MKPHEHDYVNPTWRATLNNQEDWQHYIGPSVRQRWDQFTLDQREMIYSDAILFAKRVKATRLANSYA